MQILLSLFINYINFIYDCLGKIQTDRSDVMEKTGETFLAWPEALKYKKKDVHLYNGHEGFISLLKTLLKIVTVPSI